MTSKSKSSIASSQNFQGSVSAVIMFLLWGLFELLGGLGVDVGEKQVLAEVMTEAIVNFDIIKIVTVAMPSVIVPFLKLNQEGGFSFARIKEAWKTSSNFKKDIAIFLAAIAGLLGIGQLDSDFISGLFTNGFSIGAVVTLVIALTQTIISWVKISKAKKEGAKA